MRDDIAVGRKRKADWQAKRRRGMRSVVVDVAAFEREKLLAKAVRV
jgi:hypothetical protein